MKVLGTIKSRTWFGNLRSGCLDFLLRETTFNLRAAALVTVAQTSFKTRVVYREFLKRFPHKMLRLFLVSERDVESKQ